MAKTSGGVRDYGKVMYALFDSNGEQMTRAFESTYNDYTRNFITSRTHAKNSQRLSREMGYNYSVRRAIRRY